MTEKAYRQPEYPKQQCLHISRKGNPCPSEKRVHSFFCDEHEALHSEKQDDELRKIWKRQKFEYNEKRNPGAFLRKAEQDFLRAISSAIGSNDNVIDDDIDYNMDTGVAELPDGTKYKINLVKV